jgi:hypothetical protein
MVLNEIEGMQRFYRTLLENLENIAHTAVISHEGNLSSEFVPMMQLVRGLYIKWGGKYTLEESDERIFGKHVVLHDIAKKEQYDPSEKIKLDNYLDSCEDSVNEEIKDIRKSRKVKGVLFDGIYGYRKLKLKAIRDKGSELDELLSITYDSKSSTTIGDLIVYNAANQLITETYELKREIAADFNLFLNSDYRFIRAYTENYFNGEMTLTEALVKPEDVVDTFRAFINLVTIKLTYFGGETQVLEPNVATLQISVRPNLKHEGINLITANNYFNRFVLRRDELQLGAIEYMPLKALKESIGGRLYKLK